MEETKVESKAFDHSDPEVVSNYFAERYPGVTPNDVELFQGKVHAHKAAMKRMVEEVEARKRQERVDSFKQMWTPREMHAVALQQGKFIGEQEGFNFVLDKHNEEVFNLLCLYFTNDKRFEEFNHGIKNHTYSLNKGIWLQSPKRGTGKTVMLRSFYMNKRACYGYKHTTELAVMFQKYGYEAIDRFIGTVPQSPSPINFYQRESGFMYDELFAEERVNHMGSPVSVSSYIINRLYDFKDNYKDKKFMFHCTSNVDGVEIEQIAGKTFRSRMPDIFNMIQLGGIDRRI